MPCDVKQVYIHIGTHKTATTWLQHFFGKNEQELRKRGIFYPKSGRINHAQHRLAQSIWQRENKNAPLETIPVWKKLREELETAAEPSVLITSEEFEWIAKPQLIADFFGEIPVKIIVYLRRQDDYLESFYQQQVRDYEPRLTCDVHEYISSRRLHFLDYGALLDKWERGFGAENIDVRRFEVQSLKGNDIKVDCLDALGVGEPDLFQDPAARAIKHKSSIDLEALEFLRHANKLDLTLQQHNSLVWKVIEASDLLNGKGTGARKMRLLDVATRKRIEASYSVGNDAIFKKYIRENDRSGGLFRPIHDDAIVFDPPAPPSRFILACLVRDMVGEQAGGNTTP